MTDVDGIGGGTKKKKAVFIDVVSAKLKTFLVKMHEVV